MPPIADWASDGCRSASHVALFRAVPFNSPPFVVVFGRWTAEKVDVTNAIHNSGVIPDDTATVTFQGAVYEDACVDYYIYGIWARLAGAPETEGESYITLWRAAHALDFGGTDISGRIAWYRAGYYGSFSYLSGTAIPGIQPANPPPQGEDFGGLTWFIGSGGFLLGTD